MRWVWISYAPNRTESKSNAVEASSGPVAPRLPSTGVGDRHAALDPLGSWALAVYWRRTAALLTGPSEWNANGNG